MPPGDNRGPSRRAWIALVVAAITLRVAVLIVWRVINLDRYFGADPYIALAKYWLGWDPDPTELTIHCVAPGFSVFCALLFKIAGAPKLILVQISNVIFSTATPLLTAFLAWRLTGRALTAYLAGLSTAIAPALIFFTPQLQSESFYLAWQMVFFVLLLDFWSKPSWQRAFLMGLFAGALALTRSVFAVYLPFLALSLLFLGPRAFKSVVLIAWLTVGATIPIAARTITNWVVYHKFIPLTAQGGQDLYLGTARTFEQRKQRTEELIAKAAERGYDDYHHWVARDKFLRAEAVEIIKAHPFEYAVTVAIKFFRFWRPWPYPPYPPVARVVLGIYYAVLFGLAILGLVRYRKRWKDFLPIYALFACLTITHAFLDVTLRYRIPLEPFLSIFAAMGLEKFVASRI